MNNLFREVSNRVDRIFKSMIFAAAAGAAAIASLFFFSLAAFLLLQAVVRHLVGVRHHGHRLCVDRARGAHHASAARTQESSKPTASTAAAQTRVAGPPRRFVGLAACQINAPAHPSHTCRGRRLRGRSGVDGSEEQTDRSADRSDLIDTRTLQRSGNFSYQQRLSRRHCMFRSRATCVSDQQHAHMNLRTICGVLLRISVRR